MTFDPLKISFKWLTVGSHFSDSLINPSIVYLVQVKLLQGQTSLTLLSA